MPPEACLLGGAMLLARAYCYALGEGSVRDLRELCKALIEGQDGN